MHRTRIFETDVKIQVNTLNDLLSNQDEVLKEIEAQYCFQTKIKNGLAPFRGHKLKVIISGVPSHEHDVDELLSTFKTAYDAHFQERVEYVSKTNFFQRAWDTPFTNYSLVRKATGYVFRLQNQAEMPTIYDNLSRATVSIVQAEDV